MLAGLGEVMSDAPKPDQVEVDQGKPNYNQFWWDLSKSAREAQIGYGRWIINTLWLMHSGAITGLLAKWTADSPPHHIPSLVFFVVGIISGLAAAACTWLNFSIADVWHRQWAYAGKDWPSTNVDRYSKGLTLTTAWVIFFVSSSVLCLLLGALFVVFQFPAMTFWFSSQTINTFGIVLSLIGVILLFRYGMPFHVPSNGTITICIDQVDEAEIQLEKRYKRLGIFGLILIVLGAVAQIVAVWT